MPQALFRSFLLLGLFALVPARAVVIDDAGTETYNTSDPTDTDIAGWTTGWSGSGATGWNYVGQVNGASAVYLGDNWVLTAGHVGTGTFVLDGTNYTVVVGSGQSITNARGTADLTMFQISTAPDLPSLTISPTGPTVGTTVVMTGYGGGQGETWGVDTVTRRNVTVQVTGYSFKTTDFETAYTGTNYAQLVSGDSGGGDFIYNAVTRQWELAGINEAIDGSDNSYMVQLSTYASQIDGLETTAVPEPRQGGLIVLLGLMGLATARKMKSRWSQWLWSARSSPPCQG